MAITVWSKIIRTRMMEEKEKKSKRQIETDFGGSN
jgi:hypothetical protein